MQATEPLGLFSGKPRPRLYDSIIEVLRVHHYSLRTERAYLHWIRRFILLTVVLLLVVIITIALEHGSWLTSS